MKLTLTITRHGGQLPAEGASRAFGAGMVTIGRGEINDWVLPDPERLLSKRHCVVNSRDGRFSIMDTSTNGLFVNGASEALGRGNSAALSDGDRLELGDYQIEVRISDEPVLSAGPEDPFADLLDFPAGRQPASPAPAPMPAPGLAPRRDDPFHDPLADPWRPEAERKPAPSADPFGVPRGAPLIPDDDDLFGPAEPPPWRGGAQDDHLPAHEQAFRPPGPVPVIPDDWEDDIGAPPAGGPAPAAAPPSPPPAAEQPFGPAPVVTAPAAAAEPAQPAVPPDPVGVTVIPQARPEPPRATEQPAAAPSPRPVPPAAGPDTAGALAAFLAGAGVEGFDPGGESPEVVLRALGAVFRDMAEGLREILAARATIKNEFRVERTMIGAADNNPLKFSPSGDELIRLLLQPRKGYMPPDRAVRDGIEDIKAHQMATMAGMQAAVDAVLTQFDPETLKGRFEGNSVLGKLLPAARKAGYWDLYEAQYREILKEIRDSFLGLFGREFARAYEEQARKL